MIFTILKPATSVFLFFNLLVLPFFLAQANLQSNTETLNPDHDKEIHQKLIDNIQNLDITALLEQSSTYPWLKDYVYEILHTDLSFVDQLKDSKEKVEVLEALLKKTYFAPFEKTILENLIQSKKALKLSYSTEQKQLSDLVSEKFNAKNCKENYNKGKNFREFRKFQLSLKAFEAAFTCYQSTKGKLKVLNQITLTHKLKHRGPEYIQASSRYYDFTVDKFKKKQVSAWKMNSVGIQHARTLWTYKSWQSAKDTIEALKLLLKDKISFQTIYWIEARLYEEKNDLKKSLKFVDLALKEKVLDHDEYLKLYWQKFWNLYKTKNYKVAEETLRKAITIKDPDDGRSKLYYWLRELLLKQKNTTKEVAEIEKTLQTRYPLSFYSAIIRKDKKSPWAHSDLANLKSKTYEKLPKSFDLGLYRLLHGISLPATQAFLKEYYSKYKSKVSKAERLLVKRLMARNGDTLNLFLDVKAKPEICLEPESPCMDLFPSPYISTVTKASEKYKIPGELIYSIMRQESIFNPLAKSWADARGLMQLLPSLAKQIAPKVGVDYKTSLDLYHPQKNILMGSYHIKSLYVNNKRSVVLALCGYNADRRKAMMWYKTRFDNNWLEFIEEIPYSETRGYNKLVLRNFMIYAQDNKAHIKKWLPNGL